MYTCSVHHTSVRRPKLVFFFRVLPIFFPICGRMPLPALSLWSARQPCRPRLVDGRIGGGPSNVAPRSRNSPTDLLITVFARPTTVPSRLRAPAGKDSATSSPISKDAGTSVRPSAAACRRIERRDCDQN